MAEAPSNDPPLRVGYVPEHFSTPFWYSLYYHDLPPERIPFPTGTGAMIAALRAGEINVAIGLTEGWVAGLGRKPGAKEPGSGYSIVGTYVESPLTWAISTGAERLGVKGVEALKGGKLGVSRMGSGSHVMGYVLAEREGWLASTKSPFEVIPLGDFASLRAAVTDGRADAFMWEWFTSKRYFSSEFASAKIDCFPAAASSDPGPAAADSPIRPLGTIPTPWPSWMIACTPKLVESAAQGGEADYRLETFFRMLDEGITHFEESHDESVRYISGELDYSVQDAEDWMKAVKFVKGVRGVKQEVLEHVISLLNKAGVLEEDDVQEGATRMIGI